MTSDEWILGGALAVLLGIALVGTVREFLADARSRRALARRLGEDLPDRPVWKRYADGQETLRALVSEDEELRTLATRACISSDFKYGKWLFVVFIAQAVLNVIDLIHPFWISGSVLFVIPIWWYGFFRLEPRYHAWNLKCLRRWRQRAPGEWEEFALRARLSSNPIGDALRTARKSQDLEVREFARKTRRHSLGAWLIVSPLLLLMVVSYALRIVMR